MTESFEDLGLSPELLESIKACGYTTPTPIQAEAIPHILMMRDVVGLAQTGTGKTAGFTLPMIEILTGGRAKARMPRSLILSPTRELAAQIAENFDQFGQNSKLTKALLIGGSSMDKQIKIMERGVDVLIATPGRLIDLFERGKILLNDIKILVIDEADRMMDMGFIPDIEKIAGLLPVTRQTLLFSATMPPEIKRLTQKFQSNPREVAVSPPASTAVTVEQFMVKTDKKSKNRVLGQILKQEDVKNAFIFCNRKRDIAALASWLKKEGYNAGSMHGDMAQSVRTETLEGFKSGKITFLVCSDVAARGIDVQGTSHVFNYDVPMNPDDYVHRIGRTGRAGEKGHAWMLMTAAEEKFLDAILKRIGNDIEVKSIGGGKDDKASSGGKKSGSESSGAKKPRSSKPAPSKPEHRKKDDLPKAKNVKQQRDDKPSDVKGFGDDVPAFLK